MKAATPTVPPTVVPAKQAASTAPVSIPGRRDAPFGGSPSSASPSASALATSANRYREFKADGSWGSFSNLQSR